MPDSLLTPAIEAMIGRTATYTAPEPFGPAEFRYFALALADDDPVYVDDAAARDAGYDGVTAPPTFVVETNQYMDGHMDHHGYAGHSWGIEVPGTRMIRAGHDYEFGRPLRVGDRLTVEWTLLDASEHVSASGRRSLRATSEARYLDQAGETLAVNRELMVFQELT